MVDTRYAAARLSSLPLERAFGNTRGRCAVRRNTHGRSLVISVSPAARAAGVREGMTVVEARSRCPDLALRDEDPAGELGALRVAAELLFSFGPDVEVFEPDCLLVEIGRSTRALGAEESEIAARLQATLRKFGHHSTVAIADDPDTALTLTLAPTAAPATRRKPPELPAPVVAPAGGSAAALRHLPLSCLVWCDPFDDPEHRLRGRLEAAVSSLHLLGVRDVGHLAAFPAAQVASRFGDAGALVMGRALGQRRRPLRRFAPPEEAIERLELDGPQSDLEPVSFVLKRMFDRLEARLSARALSASALELRLSLDPSRRTERMRIQLARPSRSARTFLRLARERIFGALPEAIGAIEIEVIAPVPDHGAQLDLFTQHAQRIEQVEELIARLQANLGEQAVFAAELSDTHRPEAAWVARPFSIESAFAEPAVQARAKATRSTSTTPFARDLPREHFTLPPVEEGFLTAEVRDPEPLRADRVRAWPKPIQRKKEDDPLPPLPPRPLMLLAAPEPAELDRERLWWRGLPHAVRDLGRRERFECEWWRASPLEREYSVIELEDGRRLWAFVSRQEPGIWVHGMFD